MGRRMKRNFLAVAGLASLVVALTACAGNGANRDAAGMSEPEVAALSFGEQYQALGERYERMHELIAGIQLQVSEEEWDIHDSGMMRGGDYGVNSIPGATSENSYFLSTVRSLTRDEFAGEAADLGPVIRYYENKNYDFEVLDDESGGRISARALTDDGWRLEYVVQKNGQYSARVMSGTYWGPFPELLDAWMSRIADNGPDSGVPGVAVPFPSL